MIGGGGGGGSGGGGDKAMSAASSATSGQQFGGINQGTGEGGGLSGPVVLGAVAVFVLGLVGLVWAISRGK